jgi:HK97 family phage major capsid protein
MPTVKELQDKRLELKAQIEAIGSRYKNGEQWAGEDETAWNSACEAYDQNKSALDAETATVEAASKRKEAIDRRMSALGEDGKSCRTAPFGRDGGNLNDGPRNSHRFNPEARETFLKTQALAMQGWMLGDRFPDDLRPEHVEAMQNARISPHAREINIRIGETESFDRTQAYFKGGHRSGPGGVALNTQRFRNDVMAGKGSSGGFLIGETLLSRLEEAMLSYSGVLQVAELVRTETGESLRWPTMDDTSNTGGRVGEAQDAGYGTSTDPNVGRLTLQAFTFHSKFINVSRSFMNDSVIDLESRFGDMLGTRIGRKQNTDFTTGADVGNGPIGIVTAATSGVTTASASAIAPDEILDLIHSVDPAYRDQDGVGFMYHDTIFKVLRKMKDGQGRYLWTSGMQSDSPDNLYNYPFWINQAMDSTISSGKKTMLFGKLNLYKVRQVKGLRIQRLVERRAEYDEDVFIAYLRADGGLLDAGTHPVKYMTH